MKREETKTPKTGQNGSGPHFIYHVINRGDRREDNFHEDKDRELFLTTLEEACDKTDWLEEKLRLDDEEAFKGVRRSWCLGSKQFRQELLERMHTSLKSTHSAGERRESAQARAERLIREELKPRGWTRTQLEKLRKGDGEKVKIARRLRQETTVPSAWIAKELAMGTGGNAGNLVRAG